MRLTKAQKKKFRIRNKIKKLSTNDRYRLSVNRSTKNISAQIIDDVKKITLVSASSNTNEIKLQKKNKKELSKLVAEQLANKAKDMKITKIIFNIKQDPNTLDSVILDFSSDFSEQETSTLVGGGY